MILSDRTILELLHRGDLSISPLEAEQIQPASVDVRLGDTFLEIEDDWIDLDRPVTYNMSKADEFCLGPRSFCLATTWEYIKLPDNVTAFVEGRSSVGRIGLFVQNAGWVDPGFEGEITLELFNATHVPIWLKKGFRIGQLVFAQMDKPAVRPYSGKYQGQRNATGSLLWKDAKGGRAHD